MGIRTLIAGGGASHDFERWFDQADSATLAAGGKASVHYTAQPPEILPALKDLQVLYLSLNQPMADPALRKGILDFADASVARRKRHQPDRSYNPCREARRGAECGRSARSVRRGGGWKRDDGSRTEGHGESRGTTSGA